MNISITLIGMLISLFSLPLLLVLSGHSLCILMAYAFIWPILFMIKGVFQASEHLFKGE